MWRWPRAVAHPDADPPAGRDLRAAMVEEYRFLYGHSLTADQIDRILLTSQNAGAAHYAQFQG